MIRKLLLGALGALSVVGMASAADLPVKGPVYKAPPPVFNWTGAYIGVAGGWAWGETRWTNAGGVTTGDFDTDGGLIGGTIGYNWQAPGSNWVWGIEADASWADISGTTPVACGTTCTSTVEWLATIRGRLGIAQSNWLFYATGGVAFAGVNYTIPGTFDTTQTEVGWTVGAGVENALSRNWSWKLEYLFVSFDTSDVFFAPTGIVADFNDIHIVRLGLNYRW